MLGADGREHDTNTVWFVGWIEPGADTSGRRLAFACFVSHSATTGGAHAAPVVAGFLERLEQASVREAELRER